MVQGQSNKPFNVLTAARLHDRILSRGGILLDMSGQQLGFPGFGDADPSESVVQKWSDCSVMKALFSQSCTVESDGLNVIVSVEKFVDAKSSCEVIAV